MRGDLLSILLVVLTIGTSPTEVTREYQDKVQGFGISVPAGWTIVPGRFHVSHYRYVQLTLNNCNDIDLRVKDRTEGSRTSYGPSTVSTPTGSSLHRRRKVGWPANSNATYCVVTG